jgi:hypothetical protein
MLATLFNNASRSSLSSVWSSMRQLQGLADIRGCILTS